MITWFITRPGLAKLWPGTVLPQIRQPLGGELLFTRRVAEHLVADPAVVGRQVDGSITLTFESCSTGTVEYNIPSINRQGNVPIERVAKDKEVLCEALIGAT